MKNISVEYDEGFIPKFWLYFRNGVDFSVSTISGHITLVLTTDQTKELKEKIENKLQEIDYQKICEVKDE